MRAHVKPHALSEHAALTALTAMERGRLEHIARSIPPDHSTVSEPVMVIGLRGRPLLRRWVIVVAAAEAVGFVMPAVVGAATASSPRAVVVPALLAAGLFEGTLLGIGQASVLRRAIPDLPARRWVVATAAGAMLAYILGLLLPSTPAMDWPPAVGIAVGSVLGVLILLTIGGSQWLVLRRHLHRADRWILITAVAWFGGLAVFLGFSTPLWQEGQPLSVTIGIGILGGLLMAGVTAWISGVGLVRMLAADD